jgi:hypothetical protein
MYEVVWQGQWWLYHNYAPSQLLFVVQPFLTEKNIHVITKLPYSLDFAPRLLAVPYSENWPEWDTFHNHGGHQIECDGRASCNGRID